MHFVDNILEWLSFFFFFFFFLHKVKWFQVLLYNSHNLTSVICLHTVCSIWPSICYHSSSKWIWEQWQWKGTSHSPKLPYYWNLTVRLFSVISRILVRGVLPLQKCRLSFGHEGSILVKHIKIVNDLMIESSSHLVRPSLATPPYRSLLLAGPQGYIPSSQSCCI